MSLVMATPQMKTALHMECGFLVTPTGKGIARLVCYHPSTEEMVNYRMHTTPDGIVTKVEVEKKVKGKNVWVELKELSSE